LKAHLINTRKDFRDMLRLLKQKSVLPSKNQEKVSRNDNDTDTSSKNDINEQAQLREK